MVDAQGTPSARARQLARELRLLRDAAGLHGKDVASSVGWSASKLSRIENGRIGISEQDLDRLIELYGIPPQQAASLRALVPQATSRGWWDAFAEAVPAEYANLLKTEADSWSVQCYCAVVPHALIQTVDYSRMVILSGARPPLSKEVERRLDIVRRRQDVLSPAQEGREPVRLSVVLDESVILRLVAARGEPQDDRAVSARQIEHLIALTAAAHPLVEIRVLNLSAGLPPISSGSFSLLTPFAGSSPDVVCFENESRAFFIDEEYEVRSYVEDFERLCEMASSPRESVSRLKAALAECRGTGTGARGE